MRAKLRSWWQRIKKHLEGTIISIFLVGLLVLIIFIVFGYIFSWDWTGLGAVNTDPKQHTKTLWDWLQLLIIPAVLTIGAIWFTARQNHDRDISLDNQREAVLQTYLDKMSELLLEKNLRKSLEDDEVRKIAHVRTLAVLSSLDNKRKGNVLQFLQESDLINKNKPIIYLGGADLSVTFHKAFPWEVYEHIVDSSWENKDAKYGAYLIGANLWGAILSGADLSRVCLRKSVLRDADLRDAKLCYADLSDADLHGANLRGADLSDADLSDADLSDAKLSDADLSNADLSDASITKDQLKQAKSLNGATMPDGSKYL